MKWLIWLVATTAAVAGCATPRTLYTWGNYEELIYASYVTPDKLPPESQVEILEKDYQQSRATNKRMPPG